jgi:hypothetical protein
MITVSFHPDRLRPWPSKAPHNFDDVVLYPGENELTPEQWEKVQLNDAFESYTEFDAIVVRTPPKTEAKAKETTTTK